MNLKFGISGYFYSSGSASSLSAPENINTFRKGEKEENVFRGCSNLSSPTAATPKSVEMEIIIIILRREVDAKDIINTFVSLLSKSSQYNWLGEFFSAQDTEV